MNNIEKAKEFATIAHKNQVRKTNGRPKTEHLFAVAKILENYGFSEDVIIAGILHDVLEDCPNYTKEDIKKEFGDVILNFVLDVSDKNKKDSWKKRKLSYIEHIKNAPLESKCICAADKIHNLGSLKEDLDLQGDKVWDVFNASKEDKKWFNIEVYKALTLNNCNHPIFEELKETIKSVHTSNEKLKILK